MNLCSDTSSYLLRGPILLCTATILTASVPAQSECKIVQDQVDEFTESHTLRITASDSSTGPHFEWLAKDGKICLRIQWTMDRSTPAVVFEGDTLMLKMENEQVLVLRSTETTVAKPALHEVGGPSTEAVYCYMVDKEQFALINHHWVQKVRIYFRHGHREFDATSEPKWQMALWRTSNCLRQSLDMEPLSPITTSSFEGDLER